MINKIQKYLLLHHPLIWNMRLIPIFLVTAITNILIFALGFFFVETKFEDNYSYYSRITNDLGMLYFVCFLVGLLMLIGWLIFYNRNNGLKTFYPCKPMTIYSEWLLIFVIVLSICLLPLTLTFGGTMKWRSLASYQEAEEAIGVLNQVQLLIASENSSESDYAYNSSYQQPIPIPNGAMPRLDTLDLDLYSLQYTQKGNVILNGYIGPSFLFYSGQVSRYSIYDYDTNYQESEDEILTKLDQKQAKLDNDIANVKDWLRNGQKTNIIDLMNKIYALHDKHNLEYGIDRDQWFNQIYRPPYFPVDYQNRIYRSKDEVPYDYILDDGTVSNGILYLQQGELLTGYMQVLRAYNNYEDLSYIFLFSLSCALVISAFIFSFRMSNGKAWLTALVATGIVMFLTAIIAISIAQLEEEVAGFLFTLFWIVLLFCLFGLILTKISSNGNKGKSTIWVNILLWLIPFIIPLFFAFFLLFRDMTNNRFRFDDDHTVTFFLVNTTFTILVMCPIAFMIHKWKSIPEE